MEASRIYHYRDFPDLFWDIRPDDVIDRHSPAVLARVLTKGSTEAIRALVDFNVVRQQFDALWLPAPVRSVWRRVLGFEPRIAGASWETRCAGVPNFATSWTSM